MVLNFILLVIIIHRIGFLFLSIPIGVIILLHTIFPLQDDQMFAEQTYKYLLRVVKIGLLFLFMTGPIRLLYSDPDYFLIKLIFACTTLFSIVFWNIKFDDTLYFRKNFIRLCLVFITATIGLLI